jgi:hypothetical protein
MTERRRVTETSRNNRSPERPNALIERESDTWRGINAVEGWRVSACPCAGAAASAYITRVRSFPWIPRARLGNSPGRTCAARGVGGFSRSLATSRGWLACGNRTGIRGRSGVGVEGLRSWGWGRRRGRVAPRVRDIYESRERDKFVGCATVVRGARIFMAD